MKETTIPTIISVRYYRPIPRRNSNDFESNVALKIKIQKRFQKFKNQIKKIINTHKKKIDNMMTKTNSRIDELLNIINDKKTVIIFKN